MTHSIDRRHFLKTLAVATPTVNYAVLTNTAHAKENQADRLHMLWVIDAQADTIGKGMLTNASQMRKVFSEIWKGRVSRFRLSEVGKEKRPRPKDVLDFIRDLRIGENDSVFFYYCGHGGWDSKIGDNGAGSGEENGHFLAMSGGRLYRFQLRDRILRLNPRGAVIVTDCCSNIAGVDPPRRRVPAKWEGFEDLFFKQRGLTDIQAATRGQFGWSSNRHGGIFTRCFNKLLCEPRGEIRRDGKDGYVSWKEFFPRLRSDTVALFHKTQDAAIKRTDGKPDIKDYKAQKPQAFFLSQWPENERYLRVKNKTGEQLCIWLQYYCYSKKAGGWHWRGGSKGLYYELKPGADTRLSETFDGGKWTVRAQRIRYRASTRTMQRAGREWNSWWKRDRWIVPIAGYAKQDDEIGTWTMSFP